MASGRRGLLQDLYSPDSGLNQTATRRVFLLAEQWLPSTDPASGHIYSPGKDLDAFAGSL